LKTAATVLAPGLCSFQTCSVPPVTRVGIRPGASHQTATDLDRGGCDPSPARDRPVHRRHPAQTERDGRAAIIAVVLPGRRLRRPALTEFLGLHE
jgi:hypothetical protein